MSVRLKHWLIPAAEQEMFRPDGEQLQAILDALTHAGWLDAAWKDRAAELAALTASGSATVADLAGVLGVSYEISLHAHDKLHTVPRDSYHEEREFTVACPSCGRECLEPVARREGQAATFDDAGTYALAPSCAGCGVALPVAELGDLALYRFGIEISLPSDSESADGGDPALMQDLQDAAGIPFDVVPIWE